MRSYIWKREQQADTVPYYRAMCNHSLHTERSSREERHRQITSDLVVKLKRE